MKDEKDLYLMDYNCPITLTRRGGPGTPFEAMRDFGPRGKWYGVGDTLLEAVGTLQDEIERNQLWKEPVNGLA